MHYIAIDLLEILQIWKIEEKIQFNGRFIKIHIQ